MTTTYDQLFLSILAMDSYNRGPVRSGSLNLAGAIGDATIGQNTTYADGFSAQQYTLNGKTVVSFQGSDFTQWGDWLSDIVNGAGIIAPGTQLYDAWNLYNSLSDSPGNITLVGHSLGGGLAGFLAAVTGSHAEVVDWMPFAVASEAYTAGTASTSNIDAISVDGEPLEAARIAAPILASAIYGPAIAAQAGVMETALESQSSAQGHFLDPVGSTSLGNLHSIGLENILLYADYNDGGSPDTNWKPAGAEFINALFDGNTASAAAAGSDTSDKIAQVNSLLLEEIAYSAINSGTMPFGDTAIRALFDDADDVGQHYDAEAVKEFAQPLEKILVQYAGALASHKISNDSLIPGIVEVDDTNHIISIDFSDAKWSQAYAGSGRPSHIVGQEELVNTALDLPADGSLSAPLSTLMTDLWGSAGYQLIQTLKLSTSDAGAAINLNVPDQTGASNGQFVAGFVAGNGNDNITGSTSNDFVSGGGGDDTINGNGGHDILAGGAGDDIFKAGNGTDIIGGGDGTDTVDYSNSDSSIRIDGSASPNFQALGAVVVGHESTADALFSVEKIIGTDQADTVVLYSNDLKSDSDGQTVDGLQEIDAGDGNDTLDLTHLGPIVWDGDHIDGNSTVFKNFDTFNMEQASSVTVDSGDMLQTYLLGNGSDYVKHLGAGSVVYTGGGSDVVNFSQGAAVADLSQQDRISLFGINLYGGIRNAASASDYAVGLFGLVDYGINSAGELVIHVPWMSSITVQGQNGPVSVGPDMFVLNYLQDSHTVGGGALNGPGDITLATVSISVSMLIDAGLDAGINSVQSQLNYGGVLLKTLVGSNWGGQDPLVLDLNGDGLSLTERTSVSPVFDLDADYYGEHSAWVLPTDGFLARDINGDGKINDGRELFSSSESGFAALGALDGNGDGVVNAADNGLADFNGDGVIDANDGFDDLKAWVDTNQNGITDAGELHSLSDYGITGFNLTTTPVGSKVAGNTVVETAQFIRNDGTTGTYGDVLLSVDNGNSVYQGPQINITPDATAEPDLKGYGTLVSLHQALSLHPELIADVNTAMAAITTPDLAAIKTAILPVLYDWAAGSPELLPNGSPLSAYDADPRNHKVIMLDDATGAAVDLAYDVETGTATVDGTERQTTTWKFVTGATFEVIAQDGGTVPDISAIAGSYGTASNYTISNVTGSDGTNYTQWTFNYANGASLIATVKAGSPLPPIFNAVVYGATSSSVWNEDLGPQIAFYGRYLGESLPLNVRPSNASDYLSALNTFLSSMDTALGFLGVRLAVQSGGLSSVFNAIHYDANSDQFVANGSQQLAPVYANLFTLAQSQPDPIAYLAKWKPIMDVVFGDFSQGDSNILNTYGYVAQNMVGGYEAVNPSFDFLAAAATLGVPSNLFVTGTGTMNGTDGNDIFYIKGANQTAEGGMGADTYVIGQHIGSTTIDDVEPALSAASDDVIRFTTINPGDVTATRDGTDLVLTVNATGETVRVTNQFTGPFPTPFGVNTAPDNGVTEIVFADGTVWQKVDMAVAVARALPNGGTQTGTSAIDVLIGGPGDDLLEGEGSSDIYEIGPNGGNDTINDYEDDFGRNSQDILSFTGGIRPDDLVFHRNGGSNDVTITFKNSTGSILIENQFTATESGVFGALYSNQIEGFAFDDGEGFSYQDLMQKVLQTYETNGNDQVYGYETDDIIQGGPGNDFMSGLGGNDTYKINLGDGQDEIFDDNGNLLSGQNDTIAFGTGITRSDLTFVRAGNSADVTVNIGTSGQSVKIDGQFTAIETGAFGTWYPDQIENITFTDGTSMTADDIRLAAIAANETSGNDTIYGFHGDDVLQGGAGDDYMSGGDGNDTYVINLGDGHDEIDDASGNLLSGQNDTLSFGPGITQSDVVFSRSGNSSDLLVRIGTNGQTVKIDNQFFRTLNWWPSQIEAFAFSDGTSLSYSQVMLAVIASSETAGNDSVYGFGTDDTLDGGAGNDSLYGGDGNDTYLFGRGYGSDTIGESNGTDTVTFKTGVTQSDLLVSRDGDDMLIKLKDPGTGLAGPEQLRIGGQFNYWQNSPIEQFTFADAPGTVLTRDDLKNLYFLQAKTSGNDTIIGTQGADALAGGTGDDLLQGGDGDDTYIFNLGDGNDTIFDFNGNLNYSSVDTLQFGAGITTANTTLIWQGADLLIKVGSGNDSVRVQGYFDWNLKQIENIVFADGTVWHQSDITSRLQNNPINGTTGADTIAGTIGPDTIDGLGGTDAVNGNGNADIFKFNSGYGQLTITQYDANKDSMLQLGGGIGTSNVSVTGDGINITLSIGSSDRVVLKNQYSDPHAGVGSVKFSDGSIWSRQDLITKANAAITYGTTGNDNITGTGGPDTFDGRGGTDYINGNDGNDTFIFNSGYGSLEIYEDDFWLDSLNTKLQFGAGIDPNSILVSNDANGRITLTLPGSDKVLLDRMAAGNLREYGVATIGFADGTTWSRNDVFAKATQGTIGNDRLYGTGGDNVFDGKGGNDYEQGNDGNDTFIFNKGYGTLEISEDDFWSDSPNTKLQLGAGINPEDITVTNDANGRITLTMTGNDKVFLDAMAAGNSTEYGVNLITFANGTTWTRNDVFAKAMIGTAGNDTLYGTRGANVIDGKGGVDYEVGNGGNDTFIFNQGYGNLRIYQMEPGSTRHSVLQFGAGINSADIRVTADGGNNMFLINTVTGAQVRLDGGLGNSGNWYGVQEVRFADGTSWNGQDLINKETTGTTGNDSLFGTSGAEVFDGKGGNDYASGNGGNDANGNDTFIFNLGYGHLEVREWDTSASKHNTLLFGAGINPGDIRVTSDGTRIFLTNSTNGDWVQLDDELGTDTSWDGIQQVQFAEGTIWNRRDLVNKETTGTTGNDSMFGTSGANTFDGKGGNDYASGNGGNDANGNDTFIFNLGYGRLEVREWDTSASKHNTLLFGAGINPADIGVTNDGTRIFLTNSTNGDRVQLDDEMGADTSWDGIQRVQFADGTTWDRRYLTGNQLTGTPGNNSLTGTAGADTIDGRGGNDTVVGGGGADRYAFDQGYGALTIDNGGVVGSAAHSELDFGGGIDQEGLWFVHSGNDLVIKRIGTSDQVTVSSWFGGDTSKQLADIKLSSGLQIDSQVNSLISAMATFAANNPGFDPVTATAMPTDTTLQSAIAASWH